jgi:hypothetical protein
MLYNLSLRYINLLDIYNSFVKLNLLLNLFQSFNFKQLKLLVLI